MELRGESEGSERERERERGLVPRVGMVAVLSGGGRESGSGRIQRW